MYARFERQARRAVRRGRPNPPRPTAMNIRLHPLVSVLLLLALALGGPLRAQSCGTITELLSKAGGAPAFADSLGPDLSGDGRYAVFSSKASNLVPGDVNGLEDVFRRDRTTGVNELVSVDALGAQGNGPSYTPSTSADGRFVGFVSHAVNLLPNDTNGMPDVFVKDMQTGAIELVSLSWLGTQGNDLSFSPQISEDGRYVAFESRATNLTGGADTNGVFDVFVRDRLFGQTRLISEAFGGGFAGGGVDSISGNGRWVAFTSSSSNVVPFDTNGVSDVFVRDHIDEVTIRVSLGPQIQPGLWTQGDGASSHGSVSADGGKVAFESMATNLVAGDTNGTSDVFVRDVSLGTTTLVSTAPSAPADDFSSEPDISGDGRRVAFLSYAGNLVGGDTNADEDVFVRDLLLGVTTRTSVSTTGQQSQDNCYTPRISRHGSTVAWSSEWGGFDPIDFGFGFDVFARGQVCTLPQPYCTAKTTSNGCQPRIDWTGEAKADLTGGFTIRATQAINQKPGLLFYGLSGRAALPFQQGYLCVQPPTKRGPVTFSGGSPPAVDDCSGVLTLDVDAYASGALGAAPLPALQVVGTVVNAQWWGRDPGYAFPDDTLLSNALEFTIRP